MKGCETGCKALTGGEIYHHKDCKYYQESLSRQFDLLKEKVNRLEKPVSQENGGLLTECCKALGWQGGTIYQVIEEIKRMRNYNNSDLGCIGCKYNVAETNVWHSDKCPDCARSEREDLYESRFSG